MDFVELESIEGLRWSWNSWPVTNAEATALVVPLSILSTPLIPFPDLPILPYDPLTCTKCGSVLNPYARVDYQTRVWVCPFCYHKNSFPRSYSEIGENSIPAELYPTYSTVEYKLGQTSGLGFSGSGQNWRNGFGSSGSFSSMTSLQGGGSGHGSGSGPAFVFVVDGCCGEEELQAVKKELLLVVAQLPENALVGLVVFDGMVRVYDLGFSECLRVVVFNGERELSSSEVIFELILFRDETMYYSLLALCKLIEV